MSERTTIGRQGGAKLLLRMPWLAAVLMLAAVPGWASNLYSWSGASSSLWSNSANWTPNGVPTDGDTLAFPAGAANLTNSNDLSAGTSFAAVASQSRWK